MLSYSELRTGTLFVLDGEPYKVLEYNFLRMQQRKPVAQTKIKSLRTGKILTRTFHQNESFSEADIEREKATFLYTHRGEYWFRKGEDAKNRFMLKEEFLGSAVNYLVPNTEVALNVFNDEIINVDIPVKMDFKVKQAPPGLRGDSAQGGSKEVIIETGLKVNTPLFINEGDIIRINTETGDYVERAEKN
jgi:elongation factor P